MGSILDVLHLASPSRRVPRHRPALVDWRALPQDLIDEVVVALWKADALAPRCGAVCTPFRDATHRAELALRQVDVPVPRPYLRIGVNESHEPMSDVVKNELATSRGRPFTFTSAIARELADRAALARHIRYKGSTFSLSKSPSTHSVPCAECVPSNLFV